MKKALFLLGSLIGLYFALDLEFVRRAIEPGLVESPLSPRHASLGIIPLPTKRERASTSVEVEIPAPVIEGDSSKARLAAQDYIEEHREVWGIQEHHALIEQNSFQSPLGTVVKYGVYQGDVPVQGYSVEVRVGTDGETVKDATVNYQPVAEVDLSEPVLSAEEIGNALGSRYQWEPGTGSAVVLFVPPGDESAPVAAQAMTVRRPGEEGPVQALFRASDGQLLHLSVPRQEAAAFHGK